MNSTDQPTRNDGKRLLIQLAEAIRGLMDLSPEDQRHCAAISRRFFKKTPAPFPQAEKPLMAVAELLEYMADGEMRN